MADDYYWCLKHERVERPPDVCPADDRLGPYPSEAAARDWKATRDAREASWKEQDDAWEGEAD